MAAPVKEIDLIVIGAGISGLICAIYAQRSGFRTLILEQAGNPGGVSTSWKRRGYTFEGGIHWLIGAREGLPLHDIWTESGALQENNPVFYKDPVYTLFDGNCRLELWRDIRKMYRILRDFAPKDRWALLLLQAEVWCFRHFHPPVQDRFALKCRYPRPFHPWEFVKMLPALLLTPFLLTFSAATYARRFRDPHVRNLIRSVVNPGINALSLIYTLSTFSAGDSGYPEGGSLRMATNMAGTFTALGGEIRYRTPALEVCMEGGRCTGVRTAEGMLKADAVVISADARTAIDKLFAAPLGEGWARQMRRHMRMETCMFLGIGVRADLSAYPRSIQVPLEEPLEVAGLRLDLIPIHNYARDKDYAPEGCTTLTTLLQGDSYDFWKKAREDGSYPEKKQAVIDTFLELLGRIIPETVGAVEVTDLATPLTYERYCGTFRGSYMTFWGPWEMTAVAPRRYKEGVYFTGQRTSLSGGLPVAATSGRDTAQLLCKDFSVEFVSR